MQPLKYTCIIYNCKVTVFCVRECVRMRVVDGWPREPKLQGTSLGTQSAGHI